MVTEPASRGRESTLLASDQRIVAIAGPLAMPALTPGDVIALFAVATTDEGLGVAAEPLGIEAIVVSVEPARVTIVIPDHAVSAVFVAQARGTIEVVLVPQEG